MNTIVLANEGFIPSGHASELNSYSKIYGDRNSIVHFDTREMELSHRWSLLSIHTSFNGNEYYKAKNITYQVSNSKFLILNEGTERASFISSASKVESFSVNFSQQFVRNYLSSLLASSDELLEDPFYVSTKSFAFSEQLYDYDESLSAQLMRLRRLVNSRDQNADEIDSSILMLFETIVVNQKKIWEEIRKIPCSKLSTKKELYERLTKAKDYAYSCYKENILVTDLADLTCLNKDYFSREFKKVFGIRPLEYIQNIRLSEGKRLLTATSKTTTEICYEIGYNDPSSFCKLFKKRFNVYPQEYRKAELAVVEADFSLT